MIDENISAEEKEARLKLFRQDCKFIAGVAKKSAMPQLSLPEVVFVGKSNVGKSSLINNLVGRKALARVSNTPGRTRQINFFALADKLMLVDLPGYGYAKISHKAQRAWEDLILNYLTNSDNIVVVCVLIDSRRGIKDHDKDVMQILEKLNRPFQIIFTKTDKISNPEKQKLLEQSLDSIKDYSYALKNFITTNAGRHDGAEELRLNLGQYRIK